MSSKIRVLTGALTDPCPVCGLKPKQGLCVAGEPDSPGLSMTLCFGCGLVQVIRDGMRCATTPEDEWLFHQPELISSIMAHAIIRSQNPLRTGEMVRQQMESES
jgi:hypothetical protein